MPRDELAVAYLKACVRILAGRVRVVSVRPRGVVLDVGSDSSPSTHRVLVGRDAKGHVVRSCDCACPTPKCWHLAAGRIAAKLHGIDV